MYALVVVCSLSAPADDPRFVAIGAGDEQPAGRVVSLARSQTITLATPTGETSIESLISLRRTDRAIPPFPTGPQLITTTGDRLAGIVLGGKGSSFRFLPSGLNVKAVAAWRVPLSSADVLWFTETPAETPVDSARYSWLAERKNRDILRYRNGDTARGTIEAFDPDATGLSFPFKPETGTAKEVTANELSAIAFNPALSRNRKPKGPYARIVLTDGSRLAIVNAVIAKGVLSGEALFGQKVELPLASVVSLDVYQGRAVYLSDIKPKKVETKGFLGVAWPWMADRTVHGAPLSIVTELGKSTAEKGLGTYPRTVLTYDLGGKYRRFEAEVGIDPAFAVRTAVSVRVEVDGKVQALPKLAALRAGPAIPIRLDVRGAKELVLITDFGLQSGAGADVNWADARLIE